MIRNNKKDIIKGMISNNCYILQKKVASEEFLKQQNDFIVVLKNGGYGGLIKKQNIMRI